MAETMNCLCKTFDKKHKIDCICSQNQLEMSLGMLLQHPPKGEGGPKPVSAANSSTQNSTLKTQNFSNHCAMLTPTALWRSIVGNQEILYSSKDNPTSDDKLKVCKARRFSNKKNSLNNIRSAG
jgi:hypothetical protein